MKIEYYPIRGRGDDGMKFQLARLRDASGNVYKGQYDQARHFGSEEELKTYLAPILGTGAEQIELVKMNL
ncbi:MAG: hypothetical protein WBN40_07830 [Pseudomonadales bacterium]